MFIPFQGRIGGILKSVKHLLVEVADGYHRVKEWADRHWFEVFIMVAALVVFGVLWFLDPRTFEDRRLSITLAATVVGAIGLALNLNFTSKTVRNSQRTLEHTMESEKAERFFKASEQLGNKDSEDARIAALYSLERLSKDFPDYYHQVIDVICTFVRRRSEDVPHKVPNDQHILDIDLNAVRTSHDIATAMTILARRSGRLGEGEEKGLDLRGANLCSIEVLDGNFERADFSDAKLLGVRWINCNFARANFFEADMRRAHHYWCCFFDSTFLGVQAQHSAWFFRDKVADVVHLIATQVTEGVEPFLKVSFTRDTDSDSVELVDGGRWLDGSEWDGAELEGALFNARDLRGMKMITTEQWSSMRVNPNVLRPGMISITTGEFFPRDQDPSPEEFTS